MRLGSGCFFNCWFCVNHLCLWSCLSLSLSLSLSLPLFVIRPAASSLLDRSHTLVQKGGSSNPSVINGKYSFDQLGHENPFTKEGDILYDVNGRDAHEKISIPTIFFNTSATYFRTCSTTSCPRSKYPPTPPRSSSPVRDGGGDVALDLISCRQNIF